MVPAAIEEKINNVRTTLTTTCADTDGDNAVTFRDTDRMNTTDKKTIQQLAFLCVIHGNGNKEIRAETDMMEVEYLKIIFRLFHIDYTENGYYTSAGKFVLIDDFVLNAEHEYADTTLLEGIDEWKKPIILQAFELGIVPYEQVRSTGYTRLSRERAIRILEIVSDIHGNRIRTESERREFQNLTQTLRAITEESDSKRFMKRMDVFRTIGSMFVEWR